MVFLKKQNDVDTKEMYINKGGENMRRENGITLIALIITIIILVILAAVSVSAVLNMKIVDYAVSGSQGYAQAGKDEEKMLDETSNKLDDTVTKIKNIQGSTQTNTSVDHSTELAAAMNDGTFFDLEYTDGTTTFDGKTLSYLGRDYSNGGYGDQYYLYDNAVYKATGSQTETTGALEPVSSVEVASVELRGIELAVLEYTVVKTDVNPSSLGYKSTTKKITLAWGTFDCVDNGNGEYAVGDNIYSATGVHLRYIGGK